MLGLLGADRNIRSIRRYLDIARVLSKYGFDQMLEVLGLADAVIMSKKLLNRSMPDITRLTSAERMRLVLEELGPTFIKLGQILSTRQDVIPAAFVREFEKLQDSVPGFPFEDVVEQISSGLGGGVEEFFLEIDPVPLAAASIAQVHRARLISGEYVAVKVRRPGIVEVVDSDISALITLAGLAERHMSGSEVYDPVGIVREFARSIRREMDFVREARTMEKFRDNFLHIPWLHFPHVYHQYSCRSVLTMEYVEGTKVSDIEKLSELGLDSKLIASRGADTFMEMVLTHGFFHGDLHPGNVLILPQNVICLLDYGIVGRLDDDLKNFLTDIFAAIVNRDADAIVSLLLFAGNISDNLDKSALKRDLSGFIDSYYETPIKEIEIGRMLIEFIGIIRRYSIRISPDLMLLIKSLVSVEGIGHTLDPSFNMIDHLRPFIAKELKQNMSPMKISRELVRTMSSYASLARNLPRDLKEIINRINQNKFKIDLEHRGLDKFTTDFDRSINRLSTSMILAAMIIGSSIIMQTDKGMKFMGFPALALAGYTVAAVIGLWLVYAIIRSGRM